MYTLTTEIWLPITEGLQRVKSDGSSVFDDLMREGDCPICGTKIESMEIEKVGGKIETVTLVPFVVNRPTLSFRSKCCSCSGGALNFVMITRRMTLEKAVHFLQNFVK